jgi:hypothetical protein
MLFPKIIRLNEASQLEWYVDKEMLQKHAVTVMEVCSFIIKRYLPLRVGGGNYVVRRHKN